jgi:hypothetical protein
LRNIDLETFYNRIDNHMLLAGLHSVNPSNLYHIIKACRLKPYSIFEGKFSKKTKLETHWVDEFGNSLRINNKQSNILVNDPLITNTKTSTDLFYARPMNEVATQSTFVWVISGTIFEEPTFLCSFYGVEGYFRSFMFYNKWFRISPLLLGLNTLDLMLPDINNIMGQGIDTGSLDVMLCMKIDVCEGIMLPPHKKYVDSFLETFDIMKGII